MSAAAAALSSKPEGNLQDGLPVNRESRGCRQDEKRASTRSCSSASRRKTTPRSGSSPSETLKLVPQIYEEIDIPWLERHLPAIDDGNPPGGLSRFTVGSSPSLFLPLAFLVGWLFTALFVALVREPLRRRLDEPFLIEAQRIRNPLDSSLLRRCFISFPGVAFRCSAELFWIFLASTMAVIGLTWLVMHLIDTGAEIIERRRPEAANAVIRLSATLMKALAVVIGLVVIFDYFAGINLTAVVAGLGVGGIAVAFAAQKTIENFLGGLFLVWDKPIRLGDFCKAGEYRGNVEHIGLRSTLIRTPTVPWSPSPTASSRRSASKTSTCATGSSSATP